VILGVYASPLAEIATLTATQITDPSIYFESVLNMDVQTITGR
jgi:hypothetical protein